MKPHALPWARMRGPILIVGLLIVVPMLAACQAGTSSSPTTGAAESEAPTVAESESASAAPSLAAVDPVSFGVLRAPTGALAVVTDEQGWYEEAGVEVEFNSFAEGGGPAIIQAMGGGEPDIALLNLATVVLALGQGTFDVQIVAVAANPAKALPLIATEDIQTVEDLRGKRVSSPPSGGQFYLLAAILDKFGMTFDDIDFRPLPVGDAQAAFVAGQLDAVISSANGAVIIQDTVPGSHVVFDGTMFDPEDNYASPDVIIATRDAVDTNPEGITRFLQGYLGQGVAYLNDEATHEEAIAAIQEYMTSVGAGLEELDATTKSVEGIEFYDLEQATELLSSDEFLTAVNAQVDFWVETGAFEEAPDVEGAVNTELIAP
jgi:ABC-type nitrate/sulfonate/bicarbonate transport system substrate-binding protein